MSIRDLFYEMKALSQASDKFYMNVSEYRGKRVAMFDYGLTIPGDFNCRAAFECRGSLFEVDENDDYVDILCRPYEKFLNLHEYDYGNSDALCAAVRDIYGVDVSSSEDIKSLDIDYVMNKEDGSIISAFNFDGELDCKSNSSLTSEYKHVAMDMLKHDLYLYDKTDTLTSQNYTVCFEYLSSHPKHQIVLAHEKSRLVVTGVRHNETGEYLHYDQLVEHFGEDRVAPQIHSWDWDDVHDLTDMEGYVVVFKCGLRIKLKTMWYLEKHRYISSFWTSPRRFWECFINGETDDVYSIVESSPPLVQHFNRMLEKSNNLYSSIVHEGESFYNEHKHMEAVDFYAVHTKHKFKYHPAKTYAAMLYRYGQERAMKKLKDQLLVRKIISNLGICDWL